MRPKISNRAVSRALAGVVGVEMGPEYPKIETLFDRDTKFKVMPNVWRLPEFEYLKDLQWIWTEKVDGTNIRVHWNGSQVAFGGKTDNAQIPAFMLARLQSKFPPELMRSVFTQNGEEALSITLYGEGYGAKIQKSGGKYNPTGVDFILFDIRIGDWWLTWEAVQDLGKKLGTDVVPVVGVGSLELAAHHAQEGIKSHWGEFQAEGLVVRPLVDLLTRSGRRVMGKIKTKDFRP